MSALLLRPKNRIQASAERFRAVGLAVTPVALMDIRTEAIEPAVLQRLSNTPAEQCVCILTSQNALSGIQHELPVHLADAHWISVGETSAQALRQLGVHSEVPSQHCSEGILSLESLQTPDNRLCLIVKGQGGRDLLQRSLAQRGFEVLVAQTYRRVKLNQASAIDTDVMKDIQVVIATSGELISAAFETFESQWLVSLPWIVVSDRAAEIAKSHGITETYVTSGASDDVLIAALKAFLE